MKDISSEAKKAGLQEPEKSVDEMTEEELRAFRTSFDPDMMGFDGEEGADEADEADEADGADEVDEAVEEKEEVAEDGNN